MKKKLFVFQILILTTLFSCAGDDDSSLVDTNLVLPKTISITYPDFPEDNSKSTLTYDGNKIVSTVESDSKTVFTYEGNVIVKQIQYILKEGKEIKDTEVNYTYENGKLKTRLIRESFSDNYPDGTYIYKTVYTHVSDVLINYINYSVEPDSKVETKNAEGSLTYKEENLIKEEQVIGSSKLARIYEYDLKNNPLKNILGFDLLLNEISDYAKNNSTKTTRVENGSTIANYPASHTYNEEGYPLKSTSFTGGGKTIEYEIEYTY